MRIYTCITVAFLMALGVDARAVCPTNAQTTIVLGNGIGRTRAQAQRDLDNILMPALVSALPPTVDQSCITSWHAYDSTFVDSNNIIVVMANFIDQLADSLAQLGIDYAATFWSYWNYGLQPPTSFQDLQRTMITSAISVFQPNLVSHEAFYNAELGLGHNVIVVAHSQGNLYVNQAYDVVTSIGGKNLFHIVAVATPAHSVADAGGTYYTLHGDVITAVFGSLPPNISNDPPSPCPTLLGFIACHFFGSSYMDLQKGDMTRPAIVNAVIERIKGRLSMDDAFNGTTINTALWNVVISPPGVGTITETNQRLEMVRTTPGVVSYQGLQSRCKVGGDFDVQVDFMLLNWPAQNFHTVRLGTMDLPQGPVGMDGIYRNSYNNENYQMRAIGGVVAEVTRTDFSGKIRLTRTGSTVQGYYWNGANFILIGTSPTTTDDTRFLIDFASPTLTSPAGVAIAFDNFKVNVGTISCPP
jgi:hypothetical protein